MLIVHTGAMFSGKTTALIKDIELLELAGLDCLILSPAIDTRQAVNTIKTHDGKTYPALTVSRFDECYKEIDKADVIAFDEIQFFSNHWITVIESLLKAGKKVIVAGLDTDYKQKQFDITMRLCSIADTVIKHKGRCAVCNKPSLFSHRLTDSTEIIDVGAEDKYIPLCRHCYSEIN